MLKKLSVLHSRVPIHILILDHMIVRLARKLPTGNFGVENLEIVLRTMNQRVLELEEGWAIIQKGVTKLINIIEALRKIYRDVYNNYLRSIVLPAIQEKHGVFLLRWANYKVLVSKLWRYFHYLDRHYTPRRRIPTVEDVGFGCFRKIVGELMKVRVKDAVISLISQEREGREIDQTLLKNVVEIFVDLGYQNEMQDLEYYVDGFEKGVFEE
ncbi:hypothetical protein MKW98_032194 [Papaver atlanticum]|uniref:Cullin N-terminal domain-containing protein n=1 Tax=Papaver atlanticum TaxID=357466 RepID=A0AAD4XCJ4_9MAGN|nr:hypothetical protein MKW98_032194 [Papaver atlanticum]